MRRALIGVALACSVSVAVADARITIFIGPQAHDGFVDIDSGIAESIADITKEFERSKDFTVMKAPESAQLTLTVVRRIVPGTAGAFGLNLPGTVIGGGTIAGVPQTAITAPGPTIMIPWDRHAIESILRVGGGPYDKAIVSEDSSGSWRMTARVVVKDVTAWLAANRSALAKP